MRKLAFAVGVAAAVLLAGGLAWKADAMTWASGTAALPGIAENYSPVTKSGCSGPGRWCPTGWVKRCGPWRCRCVPC